MAENYIDNTGLHVQNITEITEELTNAYKEIYGEDITVASDTPDGQRIGIEAQAKADVLEYSKQVYNCFDVDTVRGVQQDRLYKINNVFRKNAKYTYVNVNVTVSQAVNLDGLDADEDSATGTGYTIADSIGTNFILVNSVALTTPGTYTLEFRAQELGAVDVAPNTLTTMVTVVAGVSSVMNPEKQYITGNAQETDSAFNIRRNKSVSLAAQGFNDSLTAQLLAVDQVTTAVVYENTPDNTEIPQSALTSAIWCVVEGGLNNDIAKVIYANRTMGCAMVGNTTGTVTRPNGSVFTAYFDRPQAQSLYLNVTIKSRIGQIPDEDYIKSQLANLQFDIYQSVTSSDIVVAINNIDSSVYVVSCTLSNDGTTYASSVTPTTKDKYFTLIADNINITVAS